jgi:RNA recognition motif-containing protein
MSGSPRATINKRQRELDQKDRVKAREQRREERRARAEARAAAGEVGPPMGEPLPPLGEIEERPPPAPREELNMGTRIYVGNLAFDTSADTVREIFAEHGEVTDVHMVMDRDTGRPRGFAFVTMTSPADAAKAISAVNGTDVDGRNLRVNEAEDRPRGGGGGGFRGGGGGRGGGGRGRF